MRALLLIAGLALMATAAWAVPDGGIAEPVTWDDAGETLESTIEAAKSGQWWYLAALVVTSCMFILKRFRLLAKAGRWRYVVLPLLSITAALLAAFQGGVSLQTAIGVLTASWSTGALQELVEHGIIGKPRGSG